MTSYAAMGDRGREAARETNTRFRLRTIVKVNRVLRPYGMLGDVDLPWTEFIGECGHVVDSFRGHRAWDDEKIGKKRKRCHRCLIPKRADGRATEVTER